jgi:hypothetical protein
VVGVVTLVDRRVTNIHIHTADADAGVVVVGMDRGRVVNPAPVITTTIATAVRVEGGRVVVVLRVLVSLRILTTSNSNSAAGVCVSS